MHKTMIAALTLMLAFAAPANAQKAQQVRAKLNCSALTGKVAKFGPFRRDVVLALADGKLTADPRSLTGPGNENFSGTVSAGGDIAVTGSGSGSGHAWTYDLRGKRGGKNARIAGVAKQTGTPAGERNCTMTLYKLR